MPDCTGAELKAIRIGLGLTQAEFASGLGVTRVFVGLMERNQKKVSERTRLAALALRPTASERPLEEFDPLMRDIEAALNKNGVDFMRQFRSDGQTFDFFLPEFELGLLVSREHRPAFKPTAHVRGIITVSGKSAIEVLSVLLHGRPIRAAKPLEVGVRF